MNLKTNGFYNEKSNCRRLNHNSICHCKSLATFTQGTLKENVSLYGWTPVWPV